MTRVICTLSGGKSSAWCAGWALRTFPKESVLLYFNDTKWEHPDLYRFLRDVSRALDHPITEDSDGRSVEELFMDERMLGNSRVALCSRILKAERLQKFLEDGDTLIFGIGPEEVHRAVRIEQVYQRLAMEKGKRARLLFPLIKERVEKREIDEWLEGMGVAPPVLYQYGFSHNNCGGGCVRQGKKQWARLYETFPEVYRERERVEENMRRILGKNVSIIKGSTLKQFREELEKKPKWASLFPDEGEDGKECIGICESQE